MTTRRDFIKKSALASVGLGFAMSAKSYANIIGANDRVNVCFMGLGRRVKGYYPILSKKLNTKLLYLCDVKKSQIEKSQLELSDNLDYTPKEEEDIRRVLEDKHLDVVFMATPDHWHAPATIMALDAGKHVYVEKPCAHNPREAEVMVLRQQQTGKLVQMGNQQRSSQHTIDIVKKISEGLIGNPYKAVAYYNNKRGSISNQIKQAPPQDLNWDLFQGPAPRQEYFHDIWNYNWHWYGWKWGTAETGNNAVHELDIARWAMGVNFPESVYVDAAKQHFLDDGWEMYDTMNAVFKFPQNKTIVWDGKSRNGYTTYGSGRGTLIYGTNGMVSVNRNHYKVYDRFNNLIEESGIKSNESALTLGSGGSASTRHASNLIESIRGKETLRAPISDAVKSNHMALLANISYRCGKPLELNTLNGEAITPEAQQFWKRDYEKGWEIE
mgnify:CR=1 FL=1